VRKPRIDTFEAARRATLGALACAPLLGLAAAPRAKKRLAFLTIGDDAAEARFAGEVIKVLAGRGYAEGGRLEVLRRAWRGERGQLDELARGIVAWQPDAVATDGSVATAAMQRATQAIPIVASVADPIAGGFAKSLARPGGNITGLSQGLLEIATKVMEVTKLLVPRLTRLAIFAVDRPELNYLPAYAQKAARDLGVEPVMAYWKNPDAWVGQLRGLAAKGIHAAFWIGVTGGEKSIIAEALRARVAMVSIYEVLVELGMLASLNSEDSGFAARMAALIEQVFNGANPAEMPFQYPDRFRFVVNRRTASAIGIKLAPEILLRADRVID
jgi:putative ABC transport system substrate-binding protein